MFNWFWGRGKRREKGGSDDDPSSPPEQFTHCVVRYSVEAHVKIDPPETFTKRTQAVLHKALFNASKQVAETFYTPLPDGSVRIDHIPVPKDKKKLQ